MNLIFSCTLAVLLGFIFYDSFGVIGIAVSALLAQMAMNFIRLLLVEKYIELGLSKNMSIYGSFLLVVGFVVCFEYSEEYILIWQKILVSLCMLLSATYLYKEDVKAILKHRL